jgi:hypothetical protein
LHDLPGISCETSGFAKDFQKLAASDPDKKIALPSDIRQRQKVSGYVIEAMTGAGQVMLAFSGAKEGGEQMSSARRKEIVVEVIGVYNKNAGGAGISIDENNKSNSIILQTPKGKEADVAKYFDSMFKARSTGQLAPDSGASPTDISPEQALASAPSRVPSSGGGNGSEVSGGR